MRVKITIKASGPQLSEDAASKLLQNVFDACQQEPNTVPLPSLVSYSEYRKERYGVQKFLLIAVLIIFLALPLCFISPKFTVTKVDNPSSNSPRFEIRLDTRFPVSQVAASIDGEGLVVSEVSDHVYTVTPSKNGVLKINVRLINRQYSVTEVTVTGVDNAPPVLISDSMSGSRLSLYVKDEGMGVNYDGVYAENSSGGKLLPITAADGLLVFDMPEGTTTIYIPDNNDNVRMLVVTVFPTEETTEPGETSQGEGDASTDEAAASGQDESPQS